jgi:hypothetical protein
LADVSVKYADSIARVYGFQGVARKRNSSKLPMSELYVEIMRIKL